MKAKIIVPITGKIFHTATFQSCKILLTVLMLFIGSVAFSQDIAGVLYPRKGNSYQYQSTGSYSFIIKVEWFVTGGQIIQASNTHCTILWEQYGEQVITLKVTQGQGGGVVYKYLTVYVSGPYKIEFSYDHAGNRTTRKPLYSVARIKKERVPLDSNLLAVSFLNDNEYIVEDVHETPQEDQNNAEPQVSAVCIYPNPTNGELFVALNGINSASFVLYNAMGVSIKNETIGSCVTTINMNHLPAGHYIIQIMNKELNQAWTIIKN